MYNPRAISSGSQNELLTSFGGYKNNLIIPESCFQSELNMSSDYFPTISSRNKRGYFDVKGDKLQGLFSKEKLFYINNNKVYYGGVEVPDFELWDTDCKRTFVSMGNKILIFPDKIYFNTKTLEHGFIEGAITTKGYVTISLCKSDGEAYNGYEISDVAPKNPKPGDLWLDTSVVPRILKQYSSTGDFWMEIYDTFVRIANPNIGKAFEIFDNIKITGLSAMGLDGTHILRNKGDDFIVISGIVGRTVTESRSIYVERRIPDMDFVCESGNRLWGCNSEKNEIYASKLGDYRNFNNYMGISTDSFASTVGSDGPFTGAVSYRGYVLFFKENCVHKIYGSNPPYTITTSYIRGVQKGSSDSLKLLNETLYYKSPTGICAYEGGVPVNISRDLGDEYYTEAIGGCCKNKYYISMKNKEGKRQLFSYDQDKGIWHMEDELPVTEFVQNNYNLYFIAQNGSTRVLGIIDGENQYGEFNGELKNITLEDDFSFNCVTGLWGLEIPFSKYYKSIVIRASGSEGSILKVLFEYDSNKKWVKEGEFKFEKTSSALIPIITPRCDHLRLKLEGKGDIKIYSIYRSVEVSSELNV